MRRYITPLEIGWCDYVKIIFQSLVIIREFTVPHLWCESHMIISRLSLPVL